MTSCSANPKSPLQPAHGPMSAPPSAQRGAALFISLILLMVLSVLAVSTVRTAALEMLMAGNTQYRENAAQLAEAGIDATLRQPPVAPPTDCLAAVWAPAVRIDELAGEYTTRTCDRGLSPGEGNSGEFFNHEVTVEGRTDQRGALARVAQGYRLRAARGN